ENVVQYSIHFRESKVPTVWCSGFESFFDNAQVCRRLCDGRFAETQKISLGGSHVHVIWEISCLPHFSINNLLRSDQILIKLQRTAMIGQCAGDVWIQAAIECLNVGGNFTPIFFAQKVDVPDPLHEVDGSHR